MDKEERKVFVGSLHHTVDESMLRSLFSRFGTIKGFYRSSGYPITFAFITFKNKVQALSAVCQMDGTTLNNRKIRVSLASDRDKEFLDNISAESCESDNECINKENGKNQKDLNLSDSNQTNLNDKKSLNRRWRGFKRYYDSSDKESISSTRRTNQLKRTNSLPKFIERPANSVKRRNSLKELTHESEKIFEVHDTMEPMKKFKKSTNSLGQIDRQASSISLVESVEKFEKLKKKSFENLKKKMQEFNVVIGREQSLRMPDKPQSFPFRIAATSTRTSNSKNLITLFPKPNNASPAIDAYKRASTQTLVDNPIVLSHHSHPFIRQEENYQLRAREKPSKHGSLIAKDKNATNLHESQFQINETVFGFNQTLFVIDKNPSPMELTSTNRSNNEPKLFVIDSSPPKKFGNTTLFTDHDIDERLNRSIEIITLD